MKKYAVTLIRTVTQTCVVNNVMADNGIDAVDTAIASQGIKDWQTEGEPETFYREVKEVPEPEPEFEVEEKNITETFGADSSWEAELDISYDGDDLVSFCHISTTRKGREYCSSIGVVESFGTVEADDGDAIKVPKYVFNEIHKWALEEGY